MTEGIRVVNVFHLFKYFVANRMLRNGGVLPL